jgi:hypothetical protein
LPSDPDGDATRSHDTAAEADGGAAANIAVIEKKRRTSVAATLTAAEGRFLWLNVVIAP